MDFDYSPHFIFNAFDIEPYRKKVVVENLNLSNNQFMHPLPEKLFSEFLDEFPLEAIRYYATPRKTALRFTDSMGIEFGRCLLAAGSDSLIRLICETIAVTSRQLILQAPNYPSYQRYGALRGIRIIPSWGLGCGGVPNLLKHIGQVQSGLVVITNPSGIDGSLIPLEKMEEICVLAASCGHILVIDEAYSVFAPIDHLALCLRFPNVILVRSFSKSMGFAGLRMAALISSPTMIDYLGRWNPENGISQISAKFFEFCLDRIGLFENAWNDIRQERQKLECWIEGNLPDVSIKASHANFICVQINSGAQSELLQKSFVESGIAVRMIKCPEISMDACRVTVGNPEISDKIFPILRKYQLEYSIL